MLKKLYVALMMLSISSMVFAYPGQEIDEWVAQYINLDILDTTLAAILLIGGLKFAPQIAKYAVATLQRMFPK